MTRTWIVIATALFLGACGGGGSGGGDSPGGGGNTGGNNPPAANAFLPIDTNIRLTYSGSSLPVSFAPVDRRGSYWVAPFIYPTGGQEYFVSTEQGVSFAGFFSPFLQVSGAGTFIADARFDTPVMLFTSNTSQLGTVQVSGNGKVTISPTYGERSLSYSGTVTYMGTETVSNSVGTFQARHVRMNVTATATVEGTRFDVPYVVEYWFARGVGIVRRAEAGSVLNLTSATGPDRDGDGVMDSLDALPDNAGESVDTDGDGIGNNADTDDDNDSVPDAVDLFPLNATESTDFDHDGTGDNADTDDDNDSLPDAVDPFPRNRNNTDTDGDHIADNEDPDDDNDGVADANDPFPLDASETVDTDHDGIGDNADPDDDNDGFSDVIDRFPLDQLHWRQLSAGQSSLAAQGIFGSSVIPTASLAILAENIPWQAQSSQPWLTLNAGAGSGNATLGVSIHVDALSVGTHSAIITITDTGQPHTIEVPVQITVSAPVLNLTVTSVSFDGEFGWTDVQRPIDVTLNTGLNTYPVSISTSFDAQDAITTDFADGVASQNSRRLNVLAHPERLTGGRHTGQLTVSVDVNGLQIARTVSLEALASERVLYPSEDGVALARIAARNSLTRTIKVLDSYDVAGTEWTATVVGAPWLQVTPSGVTGDDLTITADPTGLTEDLHEGVITLTTNDHNIQQTRDVKVTLLVRNTAPSVQMEAVNGVYTHVVSDPVRPYVYAHNGANTIDVYDVHDRTALPSITGLTAALGPMATSSDGRWLFVLSPADGSVTRIDLDDTNTRITWPLTDLKPGSGQPESLAYARPHGQPMLFLGDRRVIDAETGAVYPIGVLSGIAGWPSNEGFEVAKSTPGGDRVCVVFTRFTPFLGGCFELQFGTYQTPDVRVGAQSVLVGHSVPGAGFATDLAVAADGASTIVGIEDNRTPVYRFQGLPNGSSGPVLPVEGSLLKTVRALAVGSDGTIYAEVVSNTLNRFYAFDGVDNSILIDLPLGVRPLERQLVVSGDGLAVVSLTSSDPDHPNVSTEVQFLKPY